MLLHQEMGGPVDVDILNHGQCSLTVTRASWRLVARVLLRLIYEQFLGDVITVSDGTVEIVSKLEVRESGVVVPTPQGRFTYERRSR